MQLSFWEHKNVFAKVDFTIIGSGIVGLHAAIKLRNKFPKSRIIVLEKGIFPEGGSTKNAGFACIGSLSELLADLQTHTEQEVLDLVQKRKSGLELLRKNLGDKNIDYQPFGGFELFLNTQKELLEKCQTALPSVNQLLKSVVKKDVFQRVETKKSFVKVEKHAFFNALEGQIDTGKMMQSLVRMAQRKHIQIINNCEVLSFNENSKNVTISLKDFSFETGHLLIANNGYAARLTNEEVLPARAQVLITKPIKNLKIKGTFHLDEGYYYFRNFKNRILLGGGRNLDFEAEATTELATTEIIQNALERMLSEVILPRQKFEIDQRWSGVMGVGPQKKPVVKSLSNRVHCGVRMGGMGVAIGSLIGVELADLVQ
jgi:glycine/D-amino acid oxidase-like deaminating enzyme